MRDRAPPPRWVDKAESRTRRWRLARVRPLRVRQEAALAVRPHQPNCEAGLLIRRDFLAHWTERPVPKLGAVDAQAMVATYKGTRTTAEHNARVVAARDLCNTDCTPPLTAVAIEPLVPLRLGELTPGRAIWGSVQSRNLHRDMTRALAAQLIILQGVNIQGRRGEHGSTTGAA